MPHAPDPEAVIDQAIALREQARMTEAIALLDAALRSAPGNPRLWQTLGTVHRANEDSVAAIAAFARAAQLAPADPLAAYGVAQATLEAGRPALDAFAAARRLAPGDAMLLRGAIAALLAEGRDRQAIDELGRIVDANPDWLDGQSLIARLLWGHGARDFDRHFARALERMPQSAMLWHGWIDLLIHVENFAGAAMRIAHARRALGDAPFLTFSEAVVASETGDTARADRAFDSLPYADDVGVAERLARHLLRTGRADTVEAIAKPHLGGASERRLWPYVALAWRITGDPRCAWLEGQGSLVSVVELDLDIARLADCLRRLHRPGAAPLGQSVRAGTQTDGPLFARAEPEIRSLRRQVVDAVDRHLAALSADPAHPILRHAGKRFRFAGSWSVRLTGAGHHSAHIHPLGWFSSALHVAVPSRSEMGPEPAGALELGTPPRELALPLGPLRRIAAKPGQLILFPSTLWHATAPIADGERLTVAFDIAAVG